MKIRSLHPLFDRVLVKPIKEEAELPSGVVKPDIAIEKPVIGKVVAVGPGKPYKPAAPHRPAEYSTYAMSVTVGEYVLYGKFSGTDIEVAGEVLLILREDEILAVVLID